MTKLRILFVCTGNICRSPTAEGVARGMASRLGLAEGFHFDSAGTHGYHVGEAPDLRTVRAARERGYDLSGQRARRVTDFDFEQFDLLLAMGADHLESLRRACPRIHAHKLRLFLDFGRNGGGEVPDPYYGGADGFELVLDLVEDAAGGLLRELGRRK
ncbi:MAG: low molecular weight phosphotyrosine protein phosphatase [Rhodocyclales bacterium]|nr:low molecular weight phosphotyrosine protein phosphatase [Rhodocyclales bacterium]